MCLCLCVSTACQQLLSSSDVIVYGGLRQRQAVHRIVENALPTVINIKCTIRFHSKQLVVSCLIASNLFS